MSNEPRSRLVAKQEMETGFARLVQSGEMPSNYRVHVSLTQYAGFEVGPRELITLLLGAMGNATDTSFFNLSKTIDVMTGENGKEVAVATKKILEDVARKI